jgi:tagatose-6-phosphate ketose/aldose isomerase
MSNSNSVNPLAALLQLTAAEQETRGLRHTPQEIAQQPATWRKTFQLLQEHLAPLRRFLADSPQTVIFAGAGTSDYIGQCLVPLWRQAGHANAQAVASTTLLTEFDYYLRSPVLLVSFSRSGDSPESVAVIEKTLETRPQARHLVITCNAQGRMANLPPAPNIYCLVLDEATNDRGLAMTSSFTNMLVAGQLSALQQVDEDKLNLFGKSGETMLAEGATLAERLAAENFTRICYLGAGALAGAAREAALKTLELTAGRILTMAETPLGLRHGPLSALNAETLVVLFLAGEQPRRRYEINLLEEIRSKNLGCKLLIIDTLGETIPAADYVLACPTPLADVYRPPIDVIFGQLFGLFASLKHGLKPDAPSPNGAISRVVSNI